VWGRSPRRASETASTRAPAKRGVEGRSLAEPAGAQRQPNLPNIPAVYVLLLSVSQPNLQYRPTRHVLLLSTVANLQNQPAGYVLLLSPVPKQTLNPPTRYVLLISLVSLVPKLSLPRICFAFILVVLLVPNSAMAQQSSCSFVLGFLSLHDLIPQIVGDCLENQHSDPQTGDAQQTTTGGLLVWRKSDNWTAFTDGSQSWVNGPLGLQQRANDQRLSWEANPDGLPIFPPLTAGDRCHTAGLALSVVGVDAGAGNLVGTFRLTNTQDVDCTFFGYPGALLLDDAGNGLPTTVVRGGGPFTSQPGPDTVSVAPHGTAVFRLHWEQVPVGDEPTCSMAASLAVTPPDEFVALTVPIQIRACGGGHLDVTPVLPDTST
jgi:hypothetical protein